ncbi:glutaminase [Streptomyces smaragdinus]|uniref:glutaminase n=1 Tax=Streptomyces smaragdinus TaxID=2585196 RepID=UPI002B1EEEF8|nr:glutaminase [Streptomyces smaragdinus]
MDYQPLLDEIAAGVRPQIGRGAVASYIPALAGVGIGHFGMAVADIDGQVAGVGDWRRPFSVQSISKIYTLALVLAEGGEDVWRRVGREPSGTPFNSLVQLEYENGIPRNPFINAGSLVVTDRLLSLTGDARGALRTFLRAESCNRGVDFDIAVADSEAEHGHRNAALGHFLADLGNLENDVADVLAHYFSQCALAMSCRDLALATGFLARHGLRGDGSRLLSVREAKQVNGVMLTCGAYDAAGEFAYRVGLPGKSGVGGGIVAVVPGRCTVAVWSPGIDEQGNSVAGVAALDHFTTLTGWSVF